MVKILLSASAQLADSSKVFKVRAGLPKETYGEYGANFYRPGNLLIVQLKHQSNERKVSIKIKLKFSVSN